MIEIALLSVSEFGRVRGASLERLARLSLIADICRANTLAMVKRAGSGHLGTSFSAMDIVVYLYHEVLNTLSAGLDNPGRDIYFSSKGHDVPGLYSVLYSLGAIPREKFIRLRRFGGLDGHPDTGIPGIESNSGSLGMGISKGKGMAWAKRHKGWGGRVYVLTGDGEFQEGQNFEALQTAHHQGISNLTVIIDHNKVQSDKPVSEIVDLGDLGGKLGAFGWHVERCDGHDFGQLSAAVGRCREVGDRPQIIIADTIKGRGVSFMEHPQALEDGKGLYPWHAGAPADGPFEQGYAEIVGRIKAAYLAQGLGEPVFERVEPEPQGRERVTLLGEPVSEAAEDRIRAKVSDEYVAKAFGEALLEIAPSRPDLVVLDADLASDCRVRGFENAVADRFIENGIAEQDMVSMAGGLARMGLLPVVNSFAAFLASRANEQIYNNASEKTKIIYALHYAGLIPAGPGKSHQSIRDISLLGALPNMTIVQPCNADETRQVVRWCVEEARENCAIRLIISPSPRVVPLPPAYRLTYGRGAVIRDGKDAVMFAYGPVMLHEALVASELLAERGFGLRVVNMSWLNRFDAAWLADAVRPFERVYVLEDHAPVGGLSDRLRDALHAAGLLDGRRLTTFAVEGWPACGTPPEALGAHGLDGISLAERLAR